MTSYPSSMTPKRNPLLPYDRYAGEPETDYYLSESEPETGKWQLVPPIITGGRIPSVKPPLQDSVSLHRQNTAPLPVQESSHLEFLMPKQETHIVAPTNVVPLFEVNFQGKDQLWYSVSARVGQHPPAPPPPAPARLSLPSVQLPAPSQQKRTATPVREPAFIPDTVLVDPPGENGQFAPEMNEKDKNFLLQVVQPSLIGLMDGSVSTLAPIFAVAFATQQPFTAFIVGMAASLGAGISMAFSEALSDDGELTGRGNPIMRGFITGLTTFISGAGHALPFLVPDIQVALVLAYIVVAVELLAIAAIRHKYFKTSWLLSILQVVGGGALVFAAAWLLGHG